MTWPTNRVRPNSEPALGAADSTSGLGDNGGAVVQFVPSFAYNRTGSGQRLLTVGGEVYQAIQASSQMQLLRLTE